MLILLFAVVAIASHSNALRLYVCFSAFAGKSTIYLLRLLCVIRLFIIDNVAAMSSLLILYATRTLQARSLTQSVSGGRLMNALNSFVHSNWKLICKDVSTQSNFLLQVNRMCREKSGSEWIGSCYNIGGIVNACVPLFTPLIEIWIEMKMRKCEIIYIEWRWQRESECSRNTTHSVYQSVFVGLFPLQTVENLSHPKINTNGALYPKVPHTFFVHDFLH